MTVNNLSKVWGQDLYVAQPGLDLEMFFPISDSWLLGS